jgi:tRNA pseudouridine55 synthase
VDKPAGPTSHDVVDRVRRALGVRRAGHTGTLDPFATGVLPVCLGRATRLAALLASGVKVYEAGARLGFGTSTDDATGRPLGQPRPTFLTRDEVESACRRFVGEIEQLPPVFSAKRVAGRRLHEMARRGESVPRRPARVTIHALDVVEVSGDVVRLRVRCSAGTYVRALARDLGQALGVGGHLTTLRRTRSGDFGLERAASWQELAGGAQVVLNKIISINELLPELPCVRVSERGRDAVRHGRALEPSWFEGEPGLAQPVRVLDEQGALLGLARVSESRLHPYLVLME